MLTPDAALGVIDMFDYLKKMFKKAEPLTPIPAEAVKQLKKERARETQVSAE